MAAKDQQWATAVELNEQLLEHNPNDLGALNRLGIAYAQLGDMSQAKKAFQQVLEIDKANIIAKKNLQRLSSQTAQLSPSFAAQNFIEEPGKTKTAELHRLAGKNVLEGLAIGQACELKPKNRYISVEIDNVYVGALPEDISFRLAKLINTGNTYSCCIRSVSANHCSVFIKELTRSKKNAEVNSFPVSKAYFGGAINEVEDLLASSLEEEARIASLTEPETEDSDNSKDFDEKDSRREE